MFNSIHRFCEKRFQKRTFYELMDEDQIFKLILQCKHLMFKFNGVYAADNFPLKMPTNSFTIVNASPASSTGSHWVVLAKRHEYPKIYFSDPLALPIYSYKHRADRFQQSTTDSIIVDLMKDRRDSKKPLQSENSQMCGLYCIYFAHYVLNDNFPFIPDINEVHLLSFVKNVK